MEADQGRDTDGIKRTYIRSIIYPKYIESGSDALAPHAFFEIECLDSAQAKTALSPYGCSVGDMEKLETVESAHGYGCRTATRSQQHLLARLRAKGKEVSEQDVRIYLGFYLLDKDVVLAAQSQVYDVLVESAPEDGEDAHCHILLRCKLKSTVENFKRLAQQSRLQIIDFLYQRMQGPALHVCPEFESVRQELQILQESLPRLPASAA